MKRGPASVRPKIQPRKIQMNKKKSVDSGEHPPLSTLLNEKPTKLYKQVQLLFMRLNTEQPLERGP